jgi:hypothetical protein
MSIAVASRSRAMQIAGCSGRCGFGAMHCTSLPHQLPSSGVAGWRRTQGKGAEGKAELAGSRLLRVRECFSFWMLEPCHPTGYVESHGRMGNPFGQSGKLVAECVGLARQTLIAWRPTSHAVWHSPSRPGCGRASSPGACSAPFCLTGFCLAGLGTPPAYDWLNGVAHLWTNARKP